MRSHPSTHSRERRCRVKESVACTTLLAMAAGTSAFLHIPDARAEVPVPPAQRAVPQGPALQPQAVVSPPARPSTQGPSPDGSMTLEAQVAATANAAARDASADSSGLLWFFAGCAFGVLGIVHAHVAKPIPPAARLMGKPPGLAFVYFTEYREQGASAQTTMAIVGCIPNTVALGVAFYFFVKALSHINLSGFGGGLH